MKILKFSLPLLLVATLAASSTYAQTNLTPASHKSDATSRLVSEKSGTVIDMSLAVPVVQRLSGYWASYDIFYKTSGTNSPSWNFCKTTGCTIYILSRSQPLRIQFDNAYVAFEIDGVAGQLYRLYVGAFGRTPDFAGLGYWMQAMDVRGFSLTNVAANFMDTAEFKARYGTNLSDAAFLTQLYSLILGRTPDAAGYAYWMDRLASGMPRAGVLASFTESATVKDYTANRVARGMQYYPWLGLTANKTLLK